jgi:ribose transport system permease protein
MMAERVRVAGRLGDLRLLRGPAASVGRLRLDRLSGLYALAILIAFFSITASGTFPTTLTFKTTLADNSVTGLLALGALLPFAAGLIDLSFANVAGLAMIVATWLSIHTGIPGPAIAVIVVAGGAAMGSLSGFFITRLGVNSLVATLGVSTVALGLAELVSSENTLTAHFSSGFSNLGQGYVWVIPLPALYLLALALGMYYLLEHTAPGRRILATGSNRAAARLAGLRVNRIRVVSLAVSGGIAGFAGIVLATQIGVATTDTGPGYLLPAIAALFLGETQIRARVNVWGTLLAVLLIGTGIKGLELLGAAPWVNDFFDGAVLLVAVGIAARARGRAKTTDGR